MSYLLDKKNKNKRLLKAIIIVVFFVLIFLFKTFIFSNLSKFSNFIFKPVIVISNNIGNNFSNLKYFFLSKKDLLEENKVLKTKVSETESLLANRNSLLDENSKLKEILDRKETNTNFILASILSKPNIYPFDALLVDVGSESGVMIGDLVFAYGNTPMGKVKEVFENSSKIVLFSTSREKTEVVISGRDVFMEIVGRGGGNFEMILPRDFVLDKGTEVVLPGIKPYVVAISQGVISDPRDSFKKALLVSPVNIQELKFVEIVK